LLAEEEQITDRFEEPTYLLPLPEAPYGAVLEATEQGVSYLAI